MNRCDVLVVGAGSVGCVLAMRLARDFGLRVTLCEPPAGMAPAIDRQRPARWLRLLNSAEDYRYATLPSEHLAGRSLVWPRGRGLGGSSRINAMIWHSPTDRDLECLERASEGTLRSSDLRHAVAEVEELIRPETPRWVSPVCEAFLASMRALGPGVEGTAMVYRRFNQLGRRWTAERLLQTAGAGAIEVVRGIVDRVLWRGDVAAGIRLADDGGELESRLGVVLCAGSIATPMILVRSGIGPSATLRPLGIDTRRVCDAVGLGLQDHLVMPLVFETDPRWRFDEQATVRDTCRWQAAGTGPLACNVAECGGLFQGGRWQLHVTPTHYLKYPEPRAESALTIAVNVAAPKSQGQVRCLSRDPHAAPEITTGYWSEPADRLDLVEGVHWVRELARQTPLADRIRRELVPGSNRREAGALGKAVARYSQTLYHPVGTCALGAGRHSVLDGHFRVRECDRLWIADGSILPQISQANPSVLLMALGWIAASKIAATDSPGTPASSLC